MGWAWPAWASRRKSRPIPGPSRNGAPANSGIRAGETTGTGTTAMTGVGPAPAASGSAGTATPGLGPPWSGRTAAAARLAPLTPRAST
ncbi:hypothetical protein MAP44135_1590 [Mycobacterium avium subsp. paratuberculosis]|nr:hypothetical protein MAP44135_1590 [Mycobacterium avium subsp. paratuberculosis]